MSIPTTDSLKFDLSQIRDFWTDQAEQHGTSYAASWSDRPVIEMEIEKITSYLADGDRVLDIGCANGFSSLALARRKQVTITGLDYIPEMINQARLRLAQLDPDVRDRVQFDVGDITQLDVADASFDTAVVIRVVINLSTWRNQERGLQEAARVVRPGGLLLLSEATLQGLEKLNAFRREWGLPPIPEPPFNQYLDEQQVVDSLQPQMELVEIANFASTYFVGTRLLKPLLAQLLGRESQVADPDMHWNRWFASLPASGDYGTQKLFVFRKRGEFRASAPG